MLRLCHVGDIEDGAARGFDLPDDDRSVVLVRTGDTFSAFLDLCPHYWTTRLAWRRDAYLTADRSAIMCAVHGATFRIDSGECLSGPCAGERLAQVDLIIKDAAVWISQDDLARPLPKSAPR